MDTQPESLGLVYLAALCYIHQVNCRDDYHDDSTVNIVLSIINIIK